MEDIDCHALGTDDAGNDFEDDQIWNYNSVYKKQSL